MLAHSSGIYFDHVYVRKELHMDHYKTKDKHFLVAIGPLKPLHANARRSKDRLANLRRLERVKRMRKRRGLSPRQLLERKLGQRTVGGDSND